MKKYYWLFILPSLLFSEYIDIQFASFSYTTGGSYGSCANFTKSGNNLSNYNLCSCAWAANVSNYTNCHELYYNPQTKIVKYNLSEGGQYTYKNFSNDYTCHNYIEEIEELECSEMNEIDCSIESTCDWIEDIEIGDCSDITNSTECYQTNQCSWYSAGPYGYWYDNCYGGTYEIDNSYCHEIEVLECSEMNELQCNIEENCSWINDSQSLNCSSLTTQECNDYLDYGCYIDADCIQWGSWYTWLCYQYGPSYCTGGNINIDDGYCEESSFVQGDVNGDGLINISDVIIIVQIILSGDYDYYSDYNQDDVVNVADVIGVINVILSN